MFSVWVFMKSKFWFWFSDSKRIQKSSRINNIYRYIGQFLGIEEQQHFVKKMKL